MIQWFEGEMHMTRVFWYMNLIRHSGMLLYDLYSEPRPYEPNSSHWALLHAHNEQSGLKGRGWSMLVRSTVCLPAKQNTTRALQASELP